MYKYMLLILIFWMLAIRPPLWVAEPKTVVVFQTQMPRVSSSAIVSSGGLLWNRLRYF